MLCQQGGSLLKNRKFLNNYMFRLSPQYSWITVSCHNPARNSHKRTGFSWRVSSSVSAGPLQGSCRLSLRSEGLAPWLTPWIFSPPQAAARKIGTLKPPGGCPLDFETRELPLADPLAQRPTETLQGRFILFWKLRFCT